MNNIRGRVCFVAVCMFMMAEAGLADPKPAWTLHFPTDRSLGAILVLDQAKVETAGYYDWEGLCEARGDVVIPAGKAVQLELSREGSLDLSPLKALEPNDVTFLFCRDTDVDDEGLQYVSHLTGLREIYLRSTQVLGPGLKYLAPLTSLKDLDLGATHVDDKALVHLLPLSSLVSLNLAGTPTGDAGMVHVGKLHSLVGLSMSNGVTDEGLSHLQGLSSLQYLSGGSQAISDTGLAYLAGLTELKRLDLRETQVTNEGLKHLSKMQKLNYLVLYETPVTEEGLKVLAGLHSLEEIAAHIDLTDKGLAYLAESSLKELTLNSDAITQVGLDAISQMKSLERVDIRGQGSMEVIIRCLADLPDLRHLDLGSGVTDEGLRLLLKRPGLEGLRLSCPHVSSNGLAILKQLTSLKQLRLSEMNQLGKRGWHEIGAITSLEGLDISHMEVTDDYLAYLAPLTRLKRLSLDHAPQMTDQGLKQVSKLSSLEMFSVFEAVLTNEGLQCLSHTPTLKWLDLQGCGVTEKGLKRLKKNIPGLDWYL